MPTKSMNSLSSEEMLNLNSPTDDEVRLLHTGVFIDYENIYYHLKNTFTNSPELGSYTSEIIRNLRLKLEDECRLQVIVMNAYADFERVGGGSLGALYLMGILSQNVLGTAHKSTADMQLCIDLMQILYTRTDIQTFVLVAGDRDYIPVVQHVKRFGRRVLVAAFRETLSGDLLEIIGESNFIDIYFLLTITSREKLEAERMKPNDNRPGLSHRLRSTTESKTPISAKTLVNYTRPIPDAPVLVSSALSDVAPAVVRRTSVLSTAAEECLTCILNFIDERNIPEPGITLLLRYLTDEMPQLANWERKQLLEELQTAGVLNITQRPGNEFPFSVAVLNYDHADVRRIK